MAVTRLPIHCSDAVWISEHEYYTRWKGRLVRVDIRKLRPVRVSDDVIRAGSVSVSDAIQPLVKAVKVARGMPC